MIQLTGVTKTYANQSKNPAVLENVNLKIGKGEFVYVVGDSRAGKTALLKMLYVEEAPTRGSVEVMGLDIGKSDQTKIQALRRRIGVIFQDLRLIEELTAYDNVALSLEIAERATDGG